MNILPLDDFIAADKDLTRQCALLDELRRQRRERLSSELARLKNLDSPDGLIIRISKAVHELLVNRLTQWSKHRRVRRRRRVGSYIRPIKHERTVLMMHKLLKGQSVKARVNEWVRSQVKQMIEIRRVEYELAHVDSVPSPEEKIVIRRIQRRTQLVKANWRRVSRALKEVQDGADTGLRVVKG